MNTANGKDFDKRQADTLPVAKAFVSALAALPCSCWAAWVLYVCNELDKQASDTYAAHKLASELAETRRLLDVRLGAGLW